MAVQSSRIMVGRDTELADLVELLGIDDPGSGRGAVLLAGDAGVGKTRLLMTLRDRAHDAGWRVDAGHCLDFGDSALPFLPFSEVLGRLAEHVPEVVAEVATAHPALARLLPGRRTRGAVEVGESEAPAPDRSDLFDAVHAVLERAAEVAPLLLVIEDLHWADRSTRELLGFLFARPFDQPVAIAASYRSDDLHRRHPLRRQAAEWARLPGVRRLPVPPLADGAVRELVTELAAGSMPEMELSGIVRRAEGNAFFVEELVASNCRDGVPDDLADLLLVRLDQLPEEARRVVRVASAAGRKVSHDLLAAASELSPAELDAGIRQAVESNVLVAGRTTYSFRHALLGEAVYDDLLPGERVRLHGRYVVALTDGGVPGTAAELARHARRAMDFDRAAVAGIEAGREAMAVGGPDEAARHFEQVLELVVDQERADRLGVDVGKVVDQAASAHAAGGDPQRGVSLLREQLNRLPPDAPTRWRARMLIRYALMLLITEHEEDLLALSRQALSLAPEGEDVVRAKVLAGHAHIAASLDRSEGRHAAPGLREEVRVAATEALALAERLDLPVLASEVATTLGTLPSDGSGSGPRAALEAAVEQAARAGAVDAELRARYLLGRFHQDDGAWDQAEQWFASAMARGIAAGLPWAPYSLESRWQLALLKYSRGEWDEVLALTSVVDDGAAPVIPRAMLATARLAVLAARGEDVVDRLGELRKVWPDEGAVAVHGAGVEIEVQGRRGDPRAALATYDDAVAVLGRIWHEQFAGRVRLAAQAMAAIARGVTAVGSADRAALLAQAERLHADGVAVAERFSDDMWGPEGRAWTQRLEAEWLRVRWLTGTDAPERDALLATWERTVTAFASLGHVPELASVRASYAAILRQVGDPGAAREQADAARATAKELGWSVLVAELTEIGSTPRRQDAGSRQLTPREREILLLVAEGRSNGEIGKQLYISTKTVSVHVSNILGKLGAAGRTEAAAVARRDGLIP